MNEEGTAPRMAFLETKEYRRFAEFCDACRTARYIGLCYGPAGVGKSFSAWHYAQWELIEAYFPGRFYDTPRLPYIEGTIVSTVTTHAPRISPELRNCRSVLYTPSVTNTPKRVGQEVHALRLALSHLVDATRPKLEHEHLLSRAVTDPTELVVYPNSWRVCIIKLAHVGLRGAFSQLTSLINWHCILPHLFIADETR